MFPNLSKDFSSPATKRSSRAEYSVNPLSVMEEFTASDFLVFLSWVTADGFRLLGLGTVDGIVDGT